MPSDGKGMSRAQEHMLIPINIYKNWQCMSRQRNEHAQIPIKLQPISSLLLAKSWQQTIVSESSLKNLSVFMNTTMKLAVSGGPRIISGVVYLTERYWNNQKQNRLSVSSVPFLNFNLNDQRRGVTSHSIHPPPRDLPLAVLCCFNSVLKIPNTHSILRG